MANTISKIDRKSASLDFGTDKGATFRHRFTWKTGPIDAEVPVDLTGATALMQIKSYSDGSTLIELSTENGRITLGGINGTIDLFIADNDTALFDWTKGYYDLDITLLSSDVRKLLRGVFISHDEITK